MSVLIDEGQLQIAEEAQRLLGGNYSGERLKGLLLSRGEFDRDLWKIMVDQGWAALSIPESYGGLGLGLLEQGLIAEACGAHVTGVPALTSSFLVSQALVQFGSEEQKQAWLPQLASGAVIGAVALAEGVESAPASPACRLDASGLHGAKPAVTAGGIADVAVVLVQSDGGPVLALADLGSGNVTREVIETFDNSRCVANLAFAVTAAEPLPGSAGNPDAAIELLRLHAVIAAFEQVGGARKMLHTARDYALTRRAFGQPIGAFQSVKHRIAEDYVAVELGRANAIHATTRHGEPDFGRYAAAARISATEAYDMVSRDAVQTHGGIGVTWEADLHLHQRRARTLALEAAPLIFWEDELVDELREDAR